MENEFEIIIFGKKLRYDEREIRFIKFRVFLHELEKKACVEVRKIFEEAGGLNKLLDNCDYVATRIDKIYMMMYKETFEYIKKWKGTENIKITDIECKDYEQGLAWQCETLHRDIIDAKLRAELDMRNKGMSSEQRQKKRMEYERESYLQLQLQFENSVREDIAEILYNTLEVFNRNNIQVYFTYQEDKANLALEYLKSNTVSVG